MSKEVLAAADFYRLAMSPEDRERLPRYRHLLDALALSRVANELLDACPPDATPVVFHSWVAAYFSRADQVAWRETMIRHTSLRAAWAYFEYPPAVMGLDPPAAATASPRLGGSQIVVTEDARGQAPWGWTHPHGRWIALSPPN